MNTVHILVAMAKVESGHARAFFAETHLGFYREYAARRRAYMHSARIVATGAQSASEAFHLRQRHLFSPLRRPPLRGALFVWQGPRSWGQVNQEGSAL